MRRGLSARLISTSHLLPSSAEFSLVLVVDVNRAGCLLAIVAFFLIADATLCSILRMEGQADVFRCRRWKPNSEDSGSSSEDEDEDEEEELSDWEIEEDLFYPPW